MSPAVFQLLTGMINVSIYITDIAFFFLFQKGYLIVCAYICTCCVRKFSYMEGEILFLKHLLHPLLLLKSSSLSVMAVLVWSPDAAYLYISDNL